MGHMLNNTIQDVLIRRARMRGFNACWVPGTDHASIATEAKVVAKLKEEGIDKHSLTREQFLQHAWEWKEKHGGIILKQLRRLGASCDWQRTAFTMDEVCSESVIKVFVDLYNKGFIYKGVRMVNWDCQARTAVSDEEVVHREEPGKFYYIRYRFASGDGHLLIATTRPETIMGDVAVCVNPHDPRYTHLHGKHVIVPLVNREVPIITDEAVDMSLGTGVLKITPAHAVDDYVIGQKYGLESIDVFNPDGTIAPAGQVYVGKDRFEARTLAVKDLYAQGLVEKEESIVHSLGYSERTNSVIEPKLSMQWFLKMEQLAAPALKAVLDEEIKLIPQKFVNTYRHWMENVRDWCLSRQLWWGHRIPAWYTQEGKVVVAENEELALEKAKELTGNPNLTAADLRQDEDVLDTWFSSWLWPIELFDGIRHPHNPEIEYYYPTNDLVTAPEILFFWVARMIIAGYEYRHERPFNHVYLTGIVRDQQRRKMSKSLGNSPDPIALMDKYGTDGVRMGMLLCSNAGNDLLFEESLTEQGRNFCNKVWNAFRLVQGWTADPKLEQSEPTGYAVALFTARLNEALVAIDRHFEEYRISEALLEAYRLFWDDFSGWLLEMVKPTDGKRIDQATLSQIQELFDKQLAVLHPFMPFITEELWHHLGNGRETKSLMVSDMPKAGLADPALLAEFEALKNVVGNIRSLRQSKGLSPKEPLNLLYRGELPLSPASLILVQRMSNVGNATPCQEAPAQAAPFITGGCEFFIPLEGLMAADEARAKVLKELEYAEGFRNLTLKKLSNERFMSNAPSSVVEAERKKLADAEAKIEALKKQLGEA
jgi:valine--tRNA ligase